MNCFSITYTERGTYSGEEFYIVIANSFAEAHNLYVNHDFSSYPNYLEKISDDDLIKDFDNFRFSENDQFYVYFHSYGDDIPDNYDNCDKTGYFKYPTTIIRELNLPVAYVGSNPGG